MSQLDDERFHVQSRCTSIRSILRELNSIDQQIQHLKDRKALLEQELDVQTGSERETWRICLERLQGQSDAADEAKNQSDKAFGYESGE